MSYSSVDLLGQDRTFDGRVTSCATEQAANTYINDTDLAVAALAAGVMRGDGFFLAAFTRLAASAPGFGDKVSQPDGSIDQTQVTDADILSAVQPSFARISELYFDSNGQRVA